VRKKLKKLNLNWKNEPRKNGKRYHSYKIKLNKHTNKLEGELIQLKPHVEIIPFDSPYAIVPTTSKIKTKTTITNYVDNVNLQELGILPVNQFINKTGPNILNISNILIYYHLDKNDNAYSQSLDLQFFQFQIDSFF
jgi:hypothetical protein